MNVAHPGPVFLALGIAACAHEPKPYVFDSEPAANDIDIVVKTLQESGLRPAQIDRNRGSVITYWFDTGYHFRETDILEPIQYPTDIFLRYRIGLRRDGEKETVVLDTDVQRCAPLDSSITRRGVSGSCYPMTVLFPTQQRQADALGERLRRALRGLGQAEQLLPSPGPSPGLSSVTATSSPLTT
jgi:hypothetical protein